MGVEHYLVCRECKQYIDLHKAYSFRHTIHAQRPPVGVDAKESGFNDTSLAGGYWSGRGLWFLWAHKAHGDKIEMHYDSNDEWYDLEPYLTEVFRHDDDIKIRERASKGFP